MDLAMTKSGAATFSGAVSRDPVSFDALYGLYRPHVYRFARALTGDPGEAEDLFQETWLRVARAFGKRPPAGDCRAWIFAIAANLHKDALRKKRVRRLFWLEKTRAAGRGIRGGGARAAAAERELVAAAGDGEAGTDFRMCLGRALAALPARQKRVFVLKEIEGFKHAEIGEILGIPENTVRTILHRAVKALQRELGRIGFRPQVRNGTGRNGRSPEAGGDEETPAARPDSPGRGKTDREGCLPDEKEKRP